MIYSSVKLDKKRQLKEITPKSLEHFKISNIVQIVGYIVFYNLEYAFRMYYVGIITNSCQNCWIYFPQFSNLIWPTILPNGFD